jgi:phosphoglycolate phosphatase-like HAD superfamily hydrolase
MKNYQAVILDFDGVVVESVGIKDDAFMELFKDFPAYLPAIMQYHRSNNATIRYEKFRYIYEEILGEAFTAEISARLGAQFSKMVFEKIVNCPFVNGAMEFLNEYHPKALLYLVSINPAQELRSILAARKIDHFFSEVYAHPWGKADAIRDILRRNAFLAKDAVFIGDSPEDFDAAQMVGIDFVGRQAARSWESRKSIVFGDMTEISNYLKIQTHAVS